MRANKGEEREIEDARNRNSLWDCCVEFYGTDCFVLRDCYNRGVVGECGLCVLNARELSFRPNQLVG